MQAFHAVLMQFHKTNAAAAHLLVRLQSVRDSLMASDDRCGLWAVHQTDGSADLAAANHRCLHLGCHSTAVPGAAATTNAGGPSAKQKRRAAENRLPVFAKEQSYPCYRSITSSTCLLLSKGAQITLNREGAATIRQSYSIADLLASCTVCVALQAWSA